MSSRHKALVSVLYRPVLNARRVFAVSRGEAERLPVLQTIAVVSITAPGRPIAKIAGFAQVLRLSFADVDHLSPKISDRARNRLMQAFTMRQAEQILTFVSQLPAEISDIVVHCEGGYSRSAAVALALHKLFGYVVELDRLKQANPTVVQLLLSAKSVCSTQSHNPAVLDISIKTAKKRK